MKHTRLNHTIAVLVLGLVLSMFVLRTPLPNTTEDDTFSTLYALEHIAELSKEPHSVYDPVEHEAVRVYLKDTLEELIGEDNVTEFTYDRALVTEEELEYDIHNLLGVIEGSSDTGILLVGHYDSRGHIGRTGELGESYGAADDGYAIATMLEIARLYADRNLMNSIYILMTDAEETGLYGAQFAAQEDFMDNIGFVINIEARGVTGPAYMFETSTNNKTVIDFYTNADMPVTYSLATAVYTVMPNSTDFTEFLAIDKQGINFAVLNGLKYYHTPLDNYTNIDPSSIEHYGRQIVPLVEAFTTNAQYSDVDYFVSDQDQVFFTLFSGVLIHYTDTVATVIHVLFFIGIVGLLGYLLWKKETTIKALGAGALRIGIAIFVAFLVGNIVARIVAFLSHVPYNMTYIRTMWGGLPTLLTLVGLGVAFVFAYHRSPKEHQQGVLLMGTLLNLTLALLTGLVLSGASFLFLVVGMTGLILLVLQVTQAPKLLQQLVLSGLMILNLLVLVPILYSLYLAITIGGLLALGVILVFYLVVLVPLFYRQLAI